MNVNRSNHTPLREATQSANSVGNESSGTTSENEHGLESDMYCKHCRKEAREMVRIPESVTDHSVFQKRDDPFYLCPTCDEQALQAVLITHNFFGDVDQTKP